jgi:RimJ/RimL family protein N-acetyltransferase
MMLDMPILETKRLIIRPFVMEDLEAVYQLLDVELDAAVLGTDKMHTLAERAEWLQWAVLNPTQLAKLHQPPYGDRAIVLRSNGKLIGACGFVPCLNVYEQLPGFAPRQRPPGESRYSTEFGLFYAISPQHQRQGYAVEAAQALVDYAFQQLRLKQIIAETDYNNLGSMGVMRKLGMRIEKNPYSEPPWLQVVGVLEAS